MGKLWKWFKSYLSDRVQCVSIGNCLSNCLPVLSGVPQGSILGPLLFLIYINDLPSAIHSSNMFTFADDTKFYENSIWARYSKISGRLVISIWMEHAITFSIPKFVFLCYKKKFNSVYSINGDIITCSDSCKDLKLGICFSVTLSWRLHLQSITSRAYKSFGLLRRIFKDVYCLTARKNLYIYLWSDLH